MTDRRARARAMADKIIDSSETDCHAWDREAKEDLGNEITNAILAFAEEEAEGLQRELACRKADLDNAVRLLKEASGFITDLVILCQPQGRITEYIHNGMPLTREESIAYTVKGALDFLKSFRVQPAAIASDTATREGK